MCQLRRSFSWHRASLMIGPVDSALSPMMMSVTLRMPSMQWTVKNWMGVLYESTNRSHVALPQCFVAEAMVPEADIVALALVAASSVAASATVRLQRMLDASCKEVEHARPLEHAVTLFVSNPKPINLLSPCT